MSVYSVTAAIMCSVGRSCLFFLPPAIIWRG
jgi:hypothetical protein